MTDTVKTFKPKTFFYRGYKITRSGFGLHDSRGGLGWRLNDSSFVFDCRHSLKKEIDFKEWLKEIDNRKGLTK